VERFCFVAAKTIAIVIAATACIPLELAPPSIPAVQSGLSGTVTGQSGLPGAVTCVAPFGKDASHESVVAKFGAANVAFDEASLGFEDFTAMATILYPHDPARRLEIFWFDDEKHSGIAEIHITGKSQWTAGPQLRLGQSLKQVEAANKKPFKLRNFNDEDYDGLVKDWRGGALDWDRSGCTVGAVFAPDGNAGEPNTEIVLSSDPSLGPARPRLVQIFIKYPRVE
jgi:hypothetical protein